MQSNTIKGKYEAAINKLTWDTKFVSTYTQRYITDPFLRINGISEYITWPLTERQDAQIASLYKNDVIPASDFRINNHVGWNAFLDDVLVNVRKDFDQEHVTATLSHLCFDGRGSSSALAPSAAVPNTLGVLIVWLPSRYLGSRLVFQSDRRSETMDDTLLPTTTLQCLATYLSTQVVSTQIMWGRRVALVYNLVCTKPECGFRTAPETQEAATAVLMEIAKEPFQRQPLVCRYTAKPSGLSFEKLSVEDAALADALLATGCYDVALATVERRGDIDPLAWGVYKTEADVIVRCILHPDCSMPGVVWVNLVGMPIDFCLELASYTHDEEALIFWHKRYRALLADAHCVMSSVRNIIVKKRERVPLAIDSTREFLLGAMSLFTHEAASRLPFHMNAMELMGSLLLIYDKWDLVRLFVAHVVSVTPTTPLHNSIGPFLRKCVVQYGWVRLRPAMLGLIDRWVPSHTGEVLQLLTSFAGITQDDVCPPVRHEDIVALVKTCWRRVLAHELLLTDDRNPVPTFVAHYLLLQWFMTQPGASEGSCLAHRLPTVLVQLVESFVSPKSGDVLEHLRSPFASIHNDSSDDEDDDEASETSSVTFDAIGFSIKLVLTLPLALVTALRSQPSMPVDAYTEALVSALGTVGAEDPSPRVESVPLSSICCIVTLLDATGRCSAAVLEHLWEIWCFSSVAALDVLLKRRPMPLSPATTALFGDFLVALAPRLPLVEEWARRRLWHERDFPSYAGDQHHAGVFPAALRILVAVAPKHIDAFAASWLRAVPCTIEANQVLLLPTIHALAGQKLVRVTALVAAKCLATFEAAWVRAPLPDLADFSLPDIFVNSTHCTACSRFRDFLLDRCLTTMDEDKPSGKCVAIARIVATHPSCLKLSKIGSTWVISKRKGGVERYADLMEALQVKHQRKKDQKMVSWLGILVAQAPVRPHDPAPSPRKRQRTLKGTIRG